MQLELASRMPDGPGRLKELFQPLTVPEEQSWLVFHGVSYHAEVFINGRLVQGHDGIWDAFAVDLLPWAGRDIQVRLDSVANGTEEYPVPDVLSGFLPYVFGTWGGAFRPVEIVESAVNPVLPRPPAPPRMTLEGRKLFLDGSPFYCRGALTWGWHPELGHPHLTPEISAREIAHTLELGFNTIKFCLWLPPHFHLEAMAKAGLMAWLELPLWAPRGEKEDLERMEMELLRIVGQYRHHGNIMAWTIGCELSDSTPPPWRKSIVQKVQELTGHPLVKDNSGGAEMYGGAPQEYGSFDDFHPYCDLPFFGPVLDSLLPGPRPPQPILLGETNDHDCIRDMTALAKDRPYWASSDPELNPQGVRWQYDYPSILDGWADRRRLQEALPRLIESSRSQSLFIRKSVFEMMRAREEIGGWVATGWRDTPISTAGMTGEDDAPRFSREELAAFNQPDCLFLVPARRPPWVNGGNRPGGQDPCVMWTDRFAVQIGLHSTLGASGEVEWSMESASGQKMAGRPVKLAAEALCSRAAPRLFAEDLDGVLSAGEWTLAASHSDGAANAWPIRLVDRPAATKWPENTSEGEGWTAFNWDGPPPGLLPAPFWREAAYDFWLHPAWEQEGWAGAWHRWFALGGDRVLDPAWLDQHVPGWKPILNRVDSRTYAEQPIVARLGALVFASLRPKGGLGSQPSGLANSPSGWELMQLLMVLANE